MEEQTHEVQRQERMKLLAAEADARWAAKPSLLENPEQEHLERPQGSTLRTTHPEAPTEQVVARPDAGQIPSVVVNNTGDPYAGSQEKGYRPGGPKEDPWKAARRGPSEDWQPEAWKPTTPQQR